MTCIQHKAQQPNAQSYRSKEKITFAALVFAHSARMRKACRNKGQRLPEDLIASAFHMDSLPTLQLLDVTRSSIMNSPVEESR